MLAPPKLRPLAQLILTLLTIHMTASDLSSTPAIVRAPTAPILSTLEDDHDVPRAVVQGVIDLFGEVDGEWKCQVRRLVAQIGLAMLQALPAAGESVDAFLSDWRAEVGDMWDELVDVTLLEVRVCLSPSFSSSSAVAVRPDAPGHTQRSARNGFFINRRQ